MRSLFAGLWLFSFCHVPVLNAAKISRTYPCYRATAPPALDGEVRHDPVWESLPVATGFSKLGDGFTLSKQTEVRACWDAEALYLGFVCEEPDVEVMKFTIADGGDAWLDDGVEIFLQPGGAGKQVYQLVVTARGKRSGFEGAPDFTKLQVAAGKGRDFYTLEMRIPERVIGAAPSAGARWRANFCRNIFTTRSGGDKFTSWAPLQSRFLEPDHFGELVFMDTPCPKETLTQLNNRLNQSYRRDLIRRISSTARLAPDFTTVLQQATADAKFGRGASDLLGRWERVKCAAAAAQQTSIAELRSIAVDASTLEDASSRLKYMFLIHRLLEEN